MVSLSGSKVGEWHIRPDGLSVKLEQQLRVWQPDVSRTEFLLRGLALYYQSVSLLRNQSPQQNPQTTPTKVQEPHDDNHKKSIENDVISERNNRLWLVIRGNGLQLLL